MFEQAVMAFQQEGRWADAARIARTLAYQCHLDGDPAGLNGWLGQARRLASEADDAVEQQWMELFDALGDPDPAAKEGRLRALVDHGHRVGASALACDALALLGQHCVQAGRVAEGLALLDEAVTAVCAGQVEEFVVVEGAFCLMLSACEVTQDVARARRWVREGEAVMAARDLASLGPLCRSYYGGVLIAAGRFEEAETTLTDAAKALEPGYTHARQGALARLADVRLRQGRFEEAEQLLTGLEEHADAAHPLAALHLARGRTALARERIDRALPAAVGVPAIRLLALRVEAQLAEGDLVGARQSLDQLQPLAARHNSPYAVAAMALARGQVCVAAGSDDAAGCLRQALAAFAEAEMPFELARTRLAFARVLAAQGPEVAVSEATRALATFEQLQASRLVDTTAELLRTLGAPARGGPRTSGTLTRREEEVLALVGHGLSNPEIAERLYISRKTVEHHVSRILAKLGLRNRAQAAAFAVRSGESVSE